MKRKDFEEQFGMMMGAAVKAAQEIMWEQHGLKFEVVIDWHLTKGGFDETDDC